ncbi:MAG: SDR family oxidoreductase [Alphaproteobacteria bacterium]|nr:SDR family oxidoreductase [Alphaproteobacteria bacterium]
MTKRVLLTGHDGYIGTVMAPFLMDRGYRVTGLDTGYFRDTLLGGQAPEIPEIRKDIRDLTPRDVEGFDAIIHLAALSNDPLGDLDRDWTRHINLDATVRLAGYAKQAGVSRFLLASSCIMYGMSETAEVDETTPLAPLTEYARSKAKCEEALSEMAGDGFSPVFIRNGTVYGYSPRMRLDTVMNDLTAQAISTGKIVIYSDGTPWRPVIHINDLVRTFPNYLEAPIDVIHNQAFNNGSDDLNYRIIELAEIVSKTVPGATLEIQSRADADQRTYKASFAKFARAFPDFAFQWNPENGAADLYETFKKLGFGGEDFDGDQFIRLHWLKHLLASGRLDETLRWKS